MERFNEAYVESLNTLQELYNQDTIVEHYNNLDPRLRNVLESILGSDVLYMEASNSDGITVLSEETNIPVYASVLNSAQATLLGEAHDDTPEDDEYDGDSDDDGSADEEERYPQDDPREADFTEAYDEDPEDAGYQGDADDDGSADEDEMHPQMKPEDDDDEVEEAYDEDEDEDEDEDDEEYEESIDPSEYDELVENLQEAIASDSFVIRTDLEEDGWLVKEGSTVYDYIRQALAEQLLSVTEAFDDEENGENFLEALIEEETSGMGIAEARKAKTKKIISKTGAVSGQQSASHIKDPSKLKKAYYQTKHWIKKNPKKTAGIGLGIAGTVAGAKYLSKKMKGKKEESLEEGKIKAATQAVGKFFRKYLPSVKKSGSAAARNVNAREVMKSVPQGQGKAILKNVRQAARKAGEKAAKSQRRKTVGVVAGTGLAGKGLHSLGKKKGKEIASKQESFNEAAPLQIADKRNILKKGLSRYKNLSKGKKAALIAIPATTAIGLTGRAIAKKRKNKENKKKLTKESMNIQEKIHIPLGPYGVIKGAIKKKKGAKLAAKGAPVTSITDDQVMKGYLKAKKKGLKGATQVAKMQAKAKQNIRKLKKKYR